MDEEVSISFPPNNLLRFIAFFFLRYLSLPVPSVQTGSGAYPASYPMGKEGKAIPVTGHEGP
jgi:hypothetical protein